MKQWKAGMFARSLAGHDQGLLYVVMDADERNVLLTDGKHHPVEKPKKKNRRHVQPDFEESGLFSADEKRKCSADENAAVRKAIKVKEGR